MRIDFFAKLAKNLSAQAESKTGRSHFLGHKKAKNEPLKKLIIVLLRKIVELQKNPI